jgi:hypothetical protein
MGMGARYCRRRHRRRRHRRRHHCLAASWLCCLRGLRAAGLRARLLLGVPAGLRWCGPRRRLYRPAGASLPRLFWWPACWRPTRVCWWPACWRPARVCWWPACWWPARVCWWPACWWPARVRWWPARWWPARVCWWPAYWRSGRLLRAALPVIRSENRNLSGQRWPAPFLSMSHVAERHADLEDRLGGSLAQSFVLG